jgi:hypothetical protein
MAYWRIEKMTCAEQKKLLTEENDSWAAFHSMKDSGSKDEKELARRYRNASDASTRLRQHIATCKICRPQ